MAMFSKDLGVDLGTMFTRIADGNQVLVEEPTIVAIEVEEQKMVAAGVEARDMYGKVPDNIEVARPLKNGVIADYEITETLLQCQLIKPVRVVTSSTMIRKGAIVSGLALASIHLLLATDMKNGAGRKVLASCLTFGSARL